MRKQCIDLNRQSWIGLGTQGVEGANKWKTVLRGREPETIAAWMRDEGGAKQNSYLSAVASDTKTSPVQALRVETKIWTKSIKQWSSEVAKVCRICGTTTTTKKRKKGKTRDERSLVSGSESLHRTVNE